MPRKLLAGIAFVASLLIPIVVLGDYRISAPGGVVVTKSGTDVGGGVQSDNVTLAQDVPFGATFVTSSNTGTTGATVATLGGAVGKTTFICGFDARANATAAVIGNLTIVGTISGTLNFTTFTVANTVALVPVTKDFSKCIPASATNTAIIVTHPAPGTGGIVSVAAWGYQK